MKTYQRKTANITWLEWLDKNIPIFMFQISGFILLMAGTGAAILFFWSLGVLMSNNNMNFVIFTFLLTLVLICSFCIPVGYRLLLLRPNKAGSIMGTFGWFGMSFFWGATAIMMIWIKEPFLAFISAAACMWSFCQAISVSKNDANNAL